MNLSDVRPLTVDKPGDRVRLMRIADDYSFAGNLGTISQDQPAPTQTRFVWVDFDAGALGAHFPCLREELEPE